MGKQEPNDVLVTLAEQLAELIPGTIPEPESLNGDRERGADAYNEGLTESEEQ